MKVEQFVVGTMGVCCYLLYCEESKKAVIIDAGGDEDTICNAIKERELELEYIISTHGHADHVCANRIIRERTGAKIIMSSTEAEFFAKDDIKEYFSHLGLEQSPPADITVEDGDTISFGKEELKVLLTPGHTPGGMCLYSEGNVFTGDTLFVGAVGRSDFPGGSYADLVLSLREKLMTLPPKTTVWPGHGYGGQASTIGVEKKTNPYC